MKKLVASMCIAITCMSAQAVTWWVGGVEFGNVCRSGVYYTVYPTHMGQPVGTSCPVRNNLGNIFAYGIVTRE